MSIFVQVSGEKTRSHIGLSSQSCISGLHQDFGHRIASLLVIHFPEMNEQFAPETRRESMAIPWPQVFLNTLQYHPGELEREPCDHTWLLDWK